MMQTEARLALLETILSQLRAWEGGRLRIDESISRSRTGGHDRHFATQSRFFLHLTGSALAISGGRLMLLGEEGQYEIAFDVVSEGSATPRQIVVAEQLAEQIERLSRIELIEPPTDV